MGTSDAITAAEGVGAMPTVDVSNTLFVLLEHCDSTDHLQAPRAAILIELALRLCEVPCVCPVQEQLRNTLKVLQAAVALNSAHVAFDSLGDSVSARSAKDNTLRYISTVIAMLAE